MLQHTLYLSRASQAGNGAQLIEQGGGLRQPGAVLKVPKTLIMTKLYREGSRRRGRVKEFAMQRPSLLPSGFSAGGCVERENQSGLSRSDRPNSFRLAEERGDGA